MSIAAIQPGVFGTGTGAARMPAGGAGTAADSRPAEGLGADRVIVSTEARQLAAGLEDQGPELQLSPAKLRELISAGEDSRGGVTMTPASSQRPDGRQFSQQSEESHVD